jgi:hypothetical protein
MKEKSKLDDPLAQGLAGLAIKAPDAYWQGHDPRDDGRLVRELFDGRIVRNEGRAKTKFPNNEPEAIEALLRLLSYGLKRFPQKDEFSEALTKLIFALNPNADTPRKLEIGFRAPGNRSDLAADVQIMLCVNELLMEGKKKKSAVSLAGETFHLSRKGVFKALRRAEEHLKKRWALEKRP